MCTLAAGKQPSTRAPTCRHRMMRAWPCGTPLQKCEISQAHARRVGYLKSMSSAILTCRHGIFKNPNWSNTQNQTQIV